MSERSYTGTHLDQERQSHARRYARIKRRLMALELVVGSLYLLLWVGLGWSVQVRAWLEGLSISLPWWTVLVALTACLSLPWYILTLPLSYYRGYLLPHRFELSNQTRRGWVGDQLRGLGLSILLGLPILIGLFATIRWLPESWWFWAAAGYSLITVVLAAVAPVLLMPIFFDLQPLGEEHQELRDRLIRLAEEAGTEIRGVYSFDMSRRTQAANAALAGLGRTRRILLGDTLLDSFEYDEIETILAHELAHHLHNDLPLSILIQSGLNFLYFYLVSIALAWSASVGWVRDLSDPAALPLLALLFGAFGLVTMPLSNAYSRWREFKADEYAISATGKPRAFADAMRRLANQNLAEVDPERWVVLLLYSHPPIRSRIRHAEGVTSEPLGLTESR